MYVLFGILMLSYFLLIKRLMKFDNKSYGSLRNVNYAYLPYLQYMSPEQRRGIITCCKRGEAGFLDFNTGYNISDIYNLG